MLVLIDMNSIIVKHFYFLMEDTGCSGSNIHPSSILNKTQKPFNTAIKYLLLKFTLKHGFHLALTNDN